MTESSPPCWKVVAGWCVLAVVLTKYSDPIIGAVVLCSLFLAEVLCQLLIAGIVTPYLSRMRPIELEEEVGQVALRWLVLTVFCVSAAYLNDLYLFQHHSFAFICTLGLSLVLAATKVTLFILSDRSQHLENVMQMRMTIAASTIVVLAKIDTLNVEIILSLNIVIVLFILMASLQMLSLVENKNPENNVQSVQMRASICGTLDVLFRNTDVLILPWILLPETAFLYLIARGIAHAVSLILSALNSKVAESLINAFACGRHGKFVSAVARSNLGILLIGGAGCLLVLTISPYLFNYLGIEIGSIQTVLMWAVLSQAAPVFFGSTWLLLDIVKKNRESMFIKAAGILSTWSLVILLDISDGVELAMLFASVHLMCAAVAATFLGIKFGIWPGLTAVFFSKIKLF